MDTILSSAYYRCPGCKGVHAKTTQLRALSEAYAQQAQVIILDGIPKTVDCPSPDCNRPINTHDLIIGQYDYNPDTGMTDAEAMPYYFAAILATILILKFGVGWPLLGAVPAGFIGGMLLGTVLLQIRKALVK